MAYLNPDGSLANYVGSSPDQLDPTKPVQGVVAPYQSLIEGQNGATPPAGSSTPTVQNGDYQGWFNQLLGSIGNPASSYDVITQLRPQLEAAGIKVNTNLEGQPSKLILPNGHYISVVDANGAWRWQDQGTSADRSTTANDLLASGSFTAPFTGSFQAPTAPAAFQAPAFTPTTAQDVLADPSFGFREQQGEQALEQSAAARGVLNTGGTLKDVLGYGQNFASQEFSNVNDRRLNAYNLAYRGAYDTANLAQNAYQSNYQNAFQKYMQDYNQFRNQQNDSWQKVFAANTVD